MVHSFWPRRSSRPQRSSWLDRLGLGILITLLFASGASAQSALYVTGSAFADIKRFDHTSEPVYYPGDGRSNDATGAGGGLRIGTFVHPSWSLELGVDAGSTTKATLPQLAAIAIYPPVPRFDFSESTRFTTVSTLVGFHPRAHGRLRLGYLGGLSFVRRTYSSDYPIYYILASSASQGSSSFTAASIPPPALASAARSTITETTYASAVMLGAEAAVGLTRHLSVVPEIRALTFSGTVLIRPGIGMRWNF